MAVEIKNKITLDLQNIDATPVVFAKQGDTGSRIVEITLTDNRMLWAIPAGVTILIRYRKANGAAGMYDTLPDGKSAYTVDATHGCITITLAPQILAEPGSVRADITIISGAQVLATFDFCVQVERSPVDNATLESQDYYKIASLAQINGAIDNLRLSVGQCVRSVNGVPPDVDGNVNAGGGAVSSVNGQTGTVLLDAASVGAVSAAGGTMTGNLNMGGKDVVNAAGVSAERFTVLHPSNDDAGAWIAAENPVTDTSGTPVKQVVALYGNYGDESTILRNVADPEQALDAANKSYVDSAIEAVSKLPGTPGADGEDGRGIVSVARTSGDGLAGTVDTYTITYTDGTTSTFTVRNGADGADGGFTGIPDGYCTTAGNAVAKVEQGFITDEIKDGSMVSIYFQNASTAANPTLSVNGKTGAILGADGTAAIYAGIESGIHLFIWYDRYNGWWLVNPKYNGLPVVETSEASVTLEPGKYYNLTGSGASLTLLFAQEQPGRKGLYCGTFYSGTPAKNLNVPASIKWVNGLNVEADKQYQFSVLDNVGVMVGV